MSVIVGIDPGPTPGIVRLEVHGGRLTELDVVQCSASALDDVLHGLVGGTYPLVAVERFVVRGRANPAQQLTRDQVAVLQARYPDAALRSASQVKPWATDERLDAADLLEATKGMRHSRDAARHALYAACKDGGMTDPLSPNYPRSAR